VEVAGLANMILALSVIVKTLLILITEFFCLASLALFQGFDPRNPCSFKLLVMLDCDDVLVASVRSIRTGEIERCILEKAAAWILGFVSPSWVDNIGVWSRFGGVWR